MNGYYRVISSGKPGKEKIGKDGLFILKVSRPFSTYFAASGYGIRHYGHRNYTVEYRERK